MLKEEARVFKPKKIHQKKRFIYKVAIFLIIVGVLIGTIYPLYKLYFSQLKLFVENNFTLKTNQENKKVISFREEVEEAVRDSFAVNEIKEETNGTKVTFADGTEIWFSPEKDLEGQLRSLQTLLSKATIENKKVRRVDFRFSKVVIEYQ